MAPDHDDPFGEMPPAQAYAEEAAAAARPADEFDPSSDEAFQAREAERERERQALYDRLNDRQAEAVNLGRVSALVLAGAGSGKTSVLTARIAKLVSTGQVTARGILAVTFTNKAAQEMRVRLSKLLDRRPTHELWMGTFHSLCNKLLREHYEAAGLPKAFAILDVDGQEALCRGILKDFGLTKAAVKEAAKQRAAAAQTDLLSAADPLAAVGGLSADDVEDDGEANEFVTPAQCAKYISSRKEQLQRPAPPQSITTRSSDIDQMEAVFAEYESRCQRAGLLDFQDLLTRGVDLLEQHPDIREQYQRRFSAILVDEFQDTNDLQYRWLELMKGPSSFVMAVGDDAQSIYRFRGANPANMHRFVEEMTKTKADPTGKVVKLEQNYRSLPHILEAANAIIDRNPGQLKKTLFTSQRDRGERIDLVTFGSGLFEASSIAESIHRMVRDHRVAPSEIAVLYRTNQQSRLLEQELNKRGVPLTVYGGYRFYERQEVKNVMAYLDLVCDMTRDLSFARVANFPPRGLGDRTVEELRQAAQASRISMMEMVGERAGSLQRDPKAFGNAAAQKKQRQLEAFTGVILDLADVATTLPLSQLIDQVMERAGIRSHYLEEARGSKSSQDEAEERLNNIAELVSAAKQFEIDNPSLKTATEQLPEYLAYVALMTSTSEADMSKKQTVSLMTVHSSKGLEFDHVFLAGLEEGTFPHSRAIEEDAERGNGKSIDAALRDMGATHDDAGNELIDDDATELEDGEGLQEERRLMYVAVTRARKTLTITHALQRMANGEPKDCEPSRFLEEIPGHRLNRIDDAKSRSGAGNKRFLRDTSNREYGGDGFDDTRTAFKPREQKRAELRTQTSFTQSDMATAPVFGGAGGVRVVSKRKGGVAEQSGETVVDVDRTHPILGNRHVLHNHEDAEERARVIEAYRQDFEADVAAGGPMLGAIRDLAARVGAGERIALRCWCAPRPCHADLLAEKILQLAREPEATALTSPAATPRPQAAEAAASKPWERGRRRAGGPALSVVASAPAATGERTVALIGTAGRDKSKPMTKQLWERMLADARRRVRPNDTLVSGGAAWADHLAVRLYLDGTVKHLVLHLPAPFNHARFVGPAESAASAANYYHDRFQKITGVDGRQEIADAMAKGATVTEQPSAPGYAAMFTRNAIVAKQATAALAYTFGAGDEPSDGGTKNTWDQVGGADRTHVDLMALGGAACAWPASSPEGTAKAGPPPSTMARLDLLSKRRFNSRP